MLPFPPLFLICIVLSALDVSISMILTLLVACTKGPVMQHRHTPTFFRLHLNSVLLRASLGFQQYLEYVFSICCTADIFALHCLSSMNASNWKDGNIHGHKILHAACHITKCYLLLAAVLGNRCVKRLFDWVLMSGVCLNRPCPNVWQCSFHAFWTQKIFSFMLMLCQYPPLFTRSPPRLLFWPAETNTPPALHTLFLPMQVSNTYVHWTAELQCKRVRKQRK